MSEQENIESNSPGCFIIILIIIGVVVLFLGGKSNDLNFFKYENRSAQEWFDSYNQELTEKNECVENLTELEDNQPTEEIKNLVICLTEAEETSRSIYQGCGKGNSKLSGQECLKLALILAEGQVGSKKECFNQYINGF